MAATVTMASSSLSHFKPRSFTSSSNKAQASLKTAMLGETELGFVNSQFAGIRISYNFDQFSSKSISAPLKLPLRPVARRVCPFTGKKSNKANKVSYSNHKTKKRQFVNLQYKKLWWEAGNRFVKLRLSTNAIKTIEKNGLDAVAKKAGIDLSKE